MNTNNTALQSDIIVAKYMDSQAIYNLEQDITALSADQQVYVYLHLNNLCLLDKSGLICIANLFKIIGKNGGRLFLKGLKGQPAKMIWSLGIDEAIESEFQEELI